MPRIAHCLAPVVLGLALAGCGANETSIYRSYSGKSATNVLIDAKQRAILSVPAGKAAYGDDKTRLRDFFVCAEPSPDALSAITSTFSASAGGAFGSGEQVQAAIARAISETATQLGQRNATIQLLRDGLYRQCEAYLNGLIDRAYYEQISNKYANAMITLLAIEELTPQKAKSESSGGGKEVTVNATTKVDVEGKSKEEKTGDADKPTEPNAKTGEDKGAAATDGSASGKASGPAPTVAVNLPDENGQIQPHVSTAVNTMVTWFLTKDTVDYCLRGLFAGKFEGGDADLKKAFIDVCKDVIKAQMAQQSQVAAAYAASASAAKFGEDQCSELLQKFWTPDGIAVDSTNEAKLKEAMKAEGVNDIITFLISDRKHAEDRRKVVARLGLGSCQ